jgi:hypothetical protein
MVTTHPRDDALTALEAAPVESTWILRRRKGEEPAEDLNLLILAQIENGLMDRNSNSTRDGDLTLHALDGFGFNKKGRALALIGPLCEGIRRVAQHLRL